MIKEKIKNLGFEYKRNYGSYKESIEKSDLSNLLAPDRLQEDTSQNESTLIIRTADSILKDYNRQRIAVFQEINKLTDSLEVNSSTTAPDIEVFKENIRIATTESKKNYVTDSTALSLNTEIIDLFKNGCDYEIENEQILFYDQDCLTKFTILNGDLTILSSKALMDRLDKFTKR